MKILLTVDPSHTSQAVVKFIRRMPFPKETEMYLLHVIELTKTDPISQSEGPFGWDKALWVARDKWENEANLFLQNLKKQFEANQNQVRMLVSEGIPGNEILQAIKTHKIEVVALGTRGLSGASRFLLGSTSEWIVTEAPCSVFIIRPPKQRTIPVSNRKLKILFATDNSDDSCYGIKLLQSLNMMESTNVILLHVAEKPGYLTTWSWGKSRDELQKFGKQVLKAEKKHGASFLSKTSQQLEDLAFTVKPVLKTGNPAEEILKAEKRLKPDIIVMGARGRTTAHSLSLGGVAKKVTRNAGSSVLVVRK